MFPDNLTRAEAQSRSALIQTESYRVLVDLTGRGLSEPETTFLTTSQVVFTARERGRTHIDLIGEEIRHAVLNGTELDATSFTGSRLPLEVVAGHNELTVTAVCRYSRSGEGLHRFIDPMDDRTYLYTQFEVSDARRVYACFEQPDLKARFQISVQAPAAWTVISNGSQSAVTALDVAPHRHTESVGAGLSQWDFAETELISTYLTAVVAGDYANVTDSYRGTGGEVSMSLLCRASLIDKLDSQRIFAATQGGFDVFEQKFGHPYAFGKYDQVFVPEYNGGAMENAGCVTLRDDYIFRSRVTAAAYEARDTTILHELSHMWFGDLVTMRWWDDLWLKESFAEWASHFSLSQSGPDPDAPWATFCNSRKNWAYRADQLPSTHPIAADMVDLEAVELNFDGITYAKGASVLRQLVAFVGLEEFLAGVRTYFDRHAFGNTELTDLLAALQEASGRDLAGWSAEWLQQPGVNTLRPSFELDAAGAYRSFAVEQTAPESSPTLRSHRIGIGLYEHRNGSLQRTGRVETDISSSRTEIAELVGRAQPDLLLVNDDDLTYAKIRLDERSQQTLVDHVDAMSSTLARAVCWGAAWDMCRDAQLVARDYVSLVLRGVGVESDLTAVSAILAQGFKAANEYTHLARRQEELDRWEAGLHELVSAAAPGSDHQVALARAYPLAVSSQAGASRLQGWLASTDIPAGLAIDAQLRWTVVTSLARLGLADDRAIDAEYRRDHTIMGAEHAAGARAAQPTPEAKVEAWRQAVDSEDVPNETQKRICLQFWQRGQDEVLQPYLERYLQAADDISASRGVWARKGISLRNNVLASLFPQPRDASAFVDRLDDWASTPDLADSVRRVVNERRDDTVRALRCQTLSAAAF